VTPAVFFKFGRKAAEEYVAREEVDPLDAVPAEPPPAPPAPRGGSGPHSRQNLGIHTPLASVNGDHDSGA